MNKIKLTDSCISKCFSQLFERLNGTQKFFEKFHVVKYLIGKKENDV